MVAYAAAAGKIAVHLTIINLFVAGSVAAYTNTTLENLLTEAVFRVYDNLSAVTTRTRIQLYFLHQFFLSFNFQVKLIICTPVNYRIPYLKINKLYKNFHRDELFQLTKI